MTSVKDCLSRALLLNKRLEAELLLAHVLGMTKEEVFAHPEKEVGEVEAQDFESFWARVEDGEPIAYILGEKEFFGLMFKTDSRALIPRPETEHLVETVMDLVRDLESPRILDVGTGCGAIALALQHALPKAMVYGSDVSEEAIELARENGQNLELGNVEFFVSDLIEGLPEEVRDVDVLVANLPYIGEEEFHFVEKAVEDYEPHVALFGGSDGLRLYQQLFDQINCSRKQPQWILGEFGSLQRERLEEMIQVAFPEGEVIFYSDLAGLDRYFKIKLDYA